MCCGGKDDGGDVASWHCLLNDLLGWIEVLKN